ncbi:hypothetical protein D3C84_1277410 [compost metagenome]
MTVFVNKEKATRIQQLDLLLDRQRWRLRAAQNLNILQGQRFQGLAELAHRIFPPNHSADGKLLL